MPTAALFGSGAVLLMVLLRIENRVSVPILPLRLLRRRVVWG
ncbi:hypothetical protein [Microbacterium pygmaeum]|nr:hypothetical protein [Microbacterium pygmaeum]